MHQELFEAIRADHRDIMALLVRLQEAGGEQERRKVLDQLLGTILPHMIAEEQIVYPALRSDAAAAEDAARAMEEHWQGQEALRLARDMPTSGDDFAERVRVARQKIEEHLWWEEERLFDDLRRVVSERDAARLLESFRREKELAWDRYPDLPLPTRDAGEIRV